MAIPPFGNAPGSLNVSAGTTSARLNNLTFANSNAISFGLSGSTITGSIDALYSGGVSNIGNTAGNTGINNNTLVLAATNDVTLNQSTNANGATVYISNPSQGTISNWEPLNLQYGSMTNLQKGNASLYFYKLDPQAHVSATRMLQLASISMSSSSNSSFAGVISVSAGIYTANGSSLSLITQSSGGTYYQWTNTSSNSMSVVTGFQGLTMALNISAQPANYWIGMVSRTSTTHTNWFTASNIVFTINNSSYQGPLLQATAATQGVQEGVGLYSTTVAALPASVAMSQITQSVFSYNAMPYMVFKNETW